MRVAVTGATGFVGTHVLAALEASGAQTVALLRPGRVWSGPAHVEVASIDLDGSHPNAFALIGKPDVLVHLAWGGLPNYRAASHLDVELPAQRGFLSSCVATGLPHLVVTGTCLEYGMESGELSEDMETHPTTAYGRAKDQLRRNLQACQGAHEFALTWLRLFYVFGPGQAEGSLYSSLKRAVHERSPVFEMSPGDQLRDFISIEEAADVVVRLALSANNRGVVNVCSGKPVSVEQRVREWLVEWNADMELRLGARPYPDYEPFAFWGSRKKLDRERSHL